MNATPAAPSDIQAKTEALLTHRFRSVDLAHPAMQTLRELGKQTVAKDMAANPSHYIIPKDAPKPEALKKSPLPQGPVELLVKEIKLPTLPQVLIELQRVLNDPKSSSNDMARVISEDPKLTATLLRIVNSALYSFPNKIDTVSRAVAVIGMRQLSTLAAGTLMLNMFTKVDPSVINLEMFWKHSIACGLISRNLASLSGKGEPERYFVGGVLHDIGRLALFSAMPDLARSVLAELDEKQCQAFEAERKVLGFDHAKLGGMILRKWEFPFSLSAAVVFHHAPQFSEKHDEPKVIHVADIVANGLGYCASRQSLVPPLDMPSWDYLGITPRQLTEMVEDLIPELEAFFSILMPS